MKRTFLILAFVFSLLITNAQLPDFEVQNLDKQWVSLNEFSGEKLTVVDFWATWCKPCVSALPKLNKIAEEVKNEGISFVGVNVDGPRNQSKVKPFVNSLNLGYQQVLDPNQDLVGHFNVTVFPTLIVLNNKGKEVFVHEGFNPGDEIIIKEELKKLLAE